MDHWVVIYAIGAAQAALLALALSRRRANRQANRVLAAWIAIVGVDLAIKSMFLAEPAAWLFKPARFVALLPFVYASLFYLYVRVLTTGRGLGRRDVVHFAAFALALAWVAPLLLLGAEETAAMFARFRAGDASWLPPWFDPLLYGSALSYLVAALVRAQRYRRKIRERRSDADRQSLRWITVMALGQLVIWGIATLHWLVRIPLIDYHLIYGAVAAWVCVVGYFSLGQPPVVELATEPATTQADEVQDRDDDPRFDEVETRLSRLMRDEQLYREPALTIGQLAKRSGYPEYLVSAVINRRFGGNFWEYINRQRIDAASTCLADPEDARTILDIAYACGFTSKSTFNAAFKRQLDATPSAYRREHASRSAGRSAASAGSTRTPPG
ncbi:MAG: AraC family transcriptional regulator [Pseudomonadota bacterium]|nr:AraC family transcriptional regulator [Pseudomonadota bacterium]